MNQAIADLEQREKTVTRDLKEKEQENRIMMFKLKELQRVMKYGQLKPIGKL